MGNRKGKMTVAERAKKCKEVYIWNSIKKVKNSIEPEIIEKYKILFSVEKALKIANTVLKFKNIRLTDQIFDECMSDAYIVYLYTIYRCASAGYSHLENYYKFMMRLAIIWNWEIAGEIKEFCKKNGLRRIYLSETSNV